MDALQQIAHLERRRGGQMDDVVDATPVEPPSFALALPPTKGPMNEGSLVHLECQVRPVRDSSMRIEWYRNGYPMPNGW